MLFFILIMRRFENNFDTKMDPFEILVVKLSLLRV